MSNLKEYEYDFTGLVFNSYISSYELVEMEKEVVNDCFDDNGMFLPHMRNTAVYKAILKHCSNFDIDKYSDEELFIICEYSNLREYIHNDDNVCNLDFIATQLYDYIYYTKDKLIHTSKLDDVINIFLEFLYSLDENKIKNFIQQISETVQDDK